MTPADLETLLASVPTGRLDLPLPALDPPVAQYFGRFLPTGQLSLTGCSRADTPDTVTVTGTGTGVPFDGLTVALRFTLNGDTVGPVSVTATGTGAAWSLARAFPALTGTLLADVSVAAPILVLDSATLATDPPPDPAGATMTFEGAVSAATLPPAVGLLFPGATHQVTGDITMVTLAPDLDFVATPTVPLVVLYGPEGTSLDLGVCTLTDLRYELIGQPVLNRATLDGEVIGSLVVTGDFPVPGTNPDGTPRDPVLAVAQFTAASDTFVLSADLSALGTITLEDVAQLVGVDSVPVPFGIDAGAGVGLGPIELAVTGSPPAFDHLSVTVHTDAEWTIVDDLLSLEAIDLVLRVNGPITDPTVSVSVDGLFGIGANGTLEIAASTDSGSIGGGLRVGDPPLNLTEVYAHFTGEDPDHLPELDVTSLQVTATLPRGNQGLTLTGGVEVYGDWAINDDVALTDVAMDLTYGPTGTTFDARAVFIVDSVGVAIQAAYDSDPAKKWQFSGETGAGQQIPIGGLVEALAQRYAGLTLPAPLARLVIENLAVAVATGAGELTVSGQAQFPVDGVTVAITVSIDTARRLFGGQLALDVPVDGGTFTPVFELRLAADPAATLLAAAYQHGADDPVPALRDLVAAVSPSAAGYVPDGIRVEPRQVVFGLVEGAGYLLGVDLDATIDLARLPVVGDHLTGDTTMGVDPLRIIAASAQLPAASVDALNALVPALPTGALPAGFTVAATLLLGPFTQSLPLTVAGAPGTTTPPAPPPPPANATPTGDNAMWLAVQRSFGPISIARVGLEFQQGSGTDRRLALLLDASITLAGLTMAMEGLAVGVSLSDPLAVPSFGLSGLGLSYRSGPVSIDAAFLKSEIEYQGVAYPSYGGAASLRTEEFALGAEGAYVQLPGGPSLFVYAFLDAPIGGPPFLQVRGLAAGFGYNRRFIPPAAADVATFPLVTEAVGGRAPGSTLADELRALNDYLPPSIGDYFLTVGVYFSSFRMVESFVLLTAVFGQRFELSLVGLSTLTLPAPDEGGGEVTPVAQIRLGVQASFVPEDGYLSLVAQLTRDSYLLSRDCHLVGGFAFSTWFAGDHAGDFVITAGGYHPHFAVPAHYPTVPRLGFSWRVSPQLAIAGTGYYALTPSALMAGGSLSASWQDDSLTASFDASMDFLLSWQPYHYEAALHVAVAAAYTFSFFGTHTIRVHLGTDVSLWGPDFGGTAILDLDVISITISFGAARVAKPDPVSWSRFRETLLPASDAMVTVALRADTKRTAADSSAEDLGIADPAGLVLVTDSAIPATAALRGSGDAEVALSTGGAVTAFGVGPAGVPPGGVSATHRIAITRDGAPAEENFTFTPVLKNLPYALWGGRITPSTADPAMIPNLLTGYTVAPAPPRQPDAAPWLDPAVLAAGAPLYTLPGAIALAAPADAVPVPGDPDELITRAVADATVAAARDGIIAAVLPGATVDLGSFDTTQFHAIPQVAAHV